MVFSWVQNWLITANRLWLDNNRTDTYLTHYCEIRPWKRGRNIFRHTIQNWIVWWALLPLCSVHPRVDIWHNEWLYALVYSMPKINRLSKSWDKGWLEGTLMQPDRETLLDTPITTNAPNTAGVGELIDVHCCIQKIHDSAYLDGTPCLIAKKHFIAQQMRHNLFLQCFYFYFKYYCSLVYAQFPSMCFEELVYEGLI